METEKTNTQPAQPSNEELVAFEKFRREYEDYMALEDGQAAITDYIGLRRDQENDLVPDSTGTILPIFSTKTTPYNSASQHNIESARESDAHAATARIAREEIAKQLHPLMEIINALKQEISSRLDTSTVNQNQLLIRLYQQKACKQALKDNSIKYDGRDIINYASWKKDLDNEIRGLMLTASQELQLLESRTPWNEKWNKVFTVVVSNI